MPAQRVQKFVRKPCRRHKLLQPLPWLKLQHKKPLEVVKPVCAVPRQQQLLKRLLPPPLVRQVNTVQLRPKPHRTRLLMRRKNPCVTLLHRPNLLQKSKPPTPLPPNLPVPRQPPPLRPPLRHPPKLPLPFQPRHNARQKDPVVPVRLKKLVKWQVAVRLVRRTQKLVLQLPKPPLLNPPVVVQRKQKRQKP